ncbi:MAG: PD40 domain-containing protein [Chloroflexi bacterium]|nr:PD40 domain-containing protein [Chloroflexota bacterium]
MLRYMGKRGRPPYPDILTPREWEVLALLRQELSNPEIAERLGISRDGAKYHVSQILGKLGLENREQAARWQSEDAQPWWATAFAPFLPGWQRAATMASGASGTAARAALFIAVLAAIGGLGLLALLLFLQSGDGDDTVTVGETPAASSAQLSYLDEDGALWLVNADGSDRIKLVDDGTCGRSSTFEWSPDGQTLVCWSGGQEGRIEVRDSSGGPLRTFIVSELLGVHWSSNSEAFGYLYRGRFSVEATSDAAYYFVVIDGTDISGLFAIDISSPFVGQASYGFPLWSPNGRRIAYNGPLAGNATYIADLDRETRTPFWPNDYPLAWALDGIALVMAEAYQPPPEGLHLPSYKAKLLEVSGRELRKLPELDDGTQFWVSPDGSTAVYLIPNFAPVEGGTVPGLGVLDLRSGEATPIANSIITYGSDSIPKEFVTFSEDGMYVYWNGGDGAVYRARLDGAGLEKLFDVGELFLSWSPDASMIAYTEPASEDEEGRTVLYVRRSDGSATYEVASVIGSRLTFAWRPVPR